MPKIMLVEDDNNLREIYEARLQAEGYTIVSAKDGEEALVIAKAEKPDLIISDVMMPKISGFEMLDILRNTDGLKEVKVIMLTALGQSDDQTRADKLGADRYLVKSQVTLEDIVKAAHDLLQDTTAAAPSPSDSPSTAAPVTDMPVAEPPQPATPATPEPAPSPVPAAQPPASETNTTPAVPPQSSAPASPSPTTSTPAVVVEPPASSDDNAGKKPAATDVPAQPDPVVPVPEPATDTAPPDTSAGPASPPSEPITPPAVPVISKPQGAIQKDTTTADKDAASTAQETAAVEARIEDFVAGATTEATPPVDAKPIQIKPQSATQTPAAASDDKLMANAVDTLIADTNGKTDQVVSPQTPAPPAVAEPISIGPVASAPEDPVNNNISIAHKKVITPLNNKPKQDINTLLVLEEAKQAAIAPPQPASIVTSGGTNPQAAATLSPVTPPATGPSVANNPNDPSHLGNITL